VSGVEESVEVPTVGTLGRVLRRWFKCGLDVDWWSDMGEGHELDMSDMHTTFETPRVLWN